MKVMDKISFKYKRVKYDIENEPVMTCQIYINNKSLIDLVKEVEMPLANITGEESIAGNYAPLTLEDLYDEVNVKDNVVDGLKQSTVLGCTCGCVECWPLYVKIEQSENYVIWSGFRNPHRFWNYSSFGPFVFDKKQYKYELKKLETLKDHEKSSQSVLGFDLANLNCGKLEILFGAGRENFSFWFDEETDDGVPEMIKLCQKLKINEPYEFEVNDQEFKCTLKMKTEIMRNNNVLLKVLRKCDTTGRDYDFEQVLEKDYCIELFEDFFKELSQNDNYPYQYPCFRFLDEASYNKVIEDADEKFNITEDEWYEDEYADYVNKRVRKDVPISDRGKIYADCYSNMLEKRIIPQEW